MLTIRTNNVPRLLKYGYEMPEKFKSDFDYIDTEEFDMHSFFVFKGQWYDIGEFMRAENCFGFSAWHGYYSDTAFSGILIKLVGDDSVIVGQYFS